MDGEQVRSALVYFGLVIGLGAIVFLVTLSLLVLLTAGACRVIGRQPPNAALYPIVVVSIIAGLAASVGAHWYIISIPQT